MARHREVTHRLAPQTAYAEIVHRAHHQHLAGASVFHGFEGYGTHLHIHHDKPSRLRTHGPCAVVPIDTEDRLRAFLDTLEDILQVNGSQSWTG